jgi:uncharacterized protein DUF6498
MTDAVSAQRPAAGVMHTLSLGVTLIGNLIPLAGVLFWDWDTFQLLMLYWMETAILAFWTLQRLARLPPDQCGNITVNGETRAATNASLVGFFALHAGVFIVVHLIFLWALFSGPWLKKVHGVSSFFSELVLTNGIWVGLLVFFIAAWISFAIDTKPAFQRRAEQKLNSTRVVAQVQEKVQEKTGGDAVGAAVAPLYIRIFIMQVAIIFGAWFAQAIGSIGPLIIVIVLKTSVDLVLGSHAPSGKDFSFSTSNVSIGG